MLAELMLASWETMARLSLMMVQGTCSPAEYRRMATEKAAAIQESTLDVMYGRRKGEALAPWHKRATANAKRLRVKRARAGLPAGKECQIGIASNVSI